MKEKTVFEPQKGKLYRLLLDLFSTGPRWTYLYTSPGRLETRGRVPDGVLVLFLEQQPVSWLRIIYGDQVGWVEGRLVEARNDNEQDH